VNSGKAAEKRPDGMPVGKPFEPDKSGNVFILGCLFRQEMEKNANRP
jgi:hypothetical protein